MKRALYHPAAREELRGAVAHDEGEHPGRGVDLEDAIGRALRRVQVLPESAPRWPPIEEVEIRRAKVRRHPYVVVYAVLANRLVVLAIAHTSKQPGYWRGRMAP